ncbi:hypothetical protein IB695_04472 [Escherichia coli]|nr:hypothetical protein ESQG_01655 [Escherichia coli H494]MBL0859376.1 hypothetical protein [Escherichia coli]SPW37418.1 Uncharacterised protein [Escherichia coli]SQQ20359.1 Uncharacterised protein [Escherichia coli]SQR76319.1 Uncharacterised protein [Escherichia coli]
MLSTMVHVPLVEGVLPFGCSCGQINNLKSKDDSNLSVIVAIKTLNVHPVCEIRSCGAVSNDRHACYM